MCVGTDATCKRKASRLLGRAVSTPAMTAHSRAAWLACHAWRDAEARTRCRCSPVHAGKDDHAEGDDVQRKVKQGDLAGGGRGVPNSEMSV